MSTWADQRRLNVSERAATLNRDAGEGPPRCCATREVVCDGLAFWGELPTELLARTRGRLPQLIAIADVDLYLCAGCRELLFREKVVTREEVARGLGLPVNAIAKAWLHDEEFHRRGATAAPAEVLAQPWWLEYESLAADQLDADPKLAAGARRRWKSDMLALLRRYEWSGH